MEDRIKQIFSKNLVTVNEDSAVYEADSKMKMHEIRHLPVTDKEGYLVGIFSRTDYKALLHVGVNLQSIKVKELMTFPVTTFSINAPVRSVAQTFVTKKISSGLIMGDGEIVGIVTADDLLRLLAEKEDAEYELNKIDLAELASEGWVSATSLR